MKARAIVANDLNNLAINFYQVLTGVFGEESAGKLKLRCANTLSHPGDMEEAERELKLASEHTNRKIEKAWAYWALCWIGRNGKGGTRYLGGAPSVRRTPNGGTNASRLVAAASALDEWAGHFKRCEWTQEDFRDCLFKTQDKADCGIYCDPPWVGAGDVYEHRFTSQAHEDLRDLLGRFIKSSIVVRYGNNPMIRDLYAGWNIIESSSRTQSNSKTSELWITNKN